MNFIQHYLAKHVKNATKTGVYQGFFLIYAYVHTAYNYVKYICRILNIDKYICLIKNYF